MDLRLYVLKTLSGLHCGVGQGLSDIDLPAAKETVSGYPFVPGSSLKGVLKDFFRGKDDAEKFQAAFGLENQAGGDDFASALSFGDARLVCLPVRSYFGTFAYMASPYSLGILKEYMQRAGKNGLPAIPALGRENGSYRAALPAESRLIPLPTETRVLLEDIDLLLNAGQASTVQAWAEIIGAMLYAGDDAGMEEARALFRERFIVVDDDVMSFLCETALPVDARIRIGQDGVVEKGALWYEEYVPPEAVFVGAVFGANGFGPYRALTARALLDHFCQKPLHCQVGGHATIGRGLVSIHFEGAGQ